MYKGIAIGGPLNGQKINSKYISVEASERGTRRDVFKDDMTISMIHRTVKYKFIEVLNGPNVFLLERDAEKLTKSLEKRAFLYNLIMKHYVK